MYKLIEHKRKIIIAITKLVLIVLVILMSFVAVGCFGYDNNNGNGNGVHDENGTYEYYVYDSANDVQVLSRDITLSDGSYKLAIYNNGQVDKEYSGEYDLYYEKDYINLVWNNNSEYGVLKDNTIQVKWGIVGDTNTLEYTKRTN